jgi:hypothetical protein
VSSGRTESIGTALLAEKEHLLPLPEEDFDLTEVGVPRVDQAGCAKVRTNFTQCHWNPPIFHHTSSFALPVREPDVTRCTLHAESEAGTPP